MRKIDEITLDLLKDKDWQNPKSFEEMGYIYFGPLVFNFFIWLKNELNGCDKVLFNSREGYFLNKIYDIFKNKFDLPESVYFKTSRKLSSIVSFKTSQDIYDSFSLHRYEGNLSDLLKNRFNIELEIKNNELIDTNINLPNLEIYINSILEKSRETRNEYEKYINHVIGSSKKIVMVDSGYQGTTQFYIQKTYDLKFKGRYLIYKGNIPLEDVCGFYDYNTSNLKQNLIFFESVFVDNVGSFIDIKNGKFINESINHNKFDFNKNKNIIKGVEKFINDMLTNDIDLMNINYELSNHIFNLMCSKDYVKNIKLFDNFYHDNFYVRTGTKKLYRI